MLAFASLFMYNINPDLAFLLLFLFLGGELG